MQRARAGLIGRAIKRSLSPSLHEAEGAACGLDYRYELFDLDDRADDPAALGVTLERLEAAGYVGCNVTFPFKQAVIPLLDSLSDEAAAMGAVNTVLFAEDGRREGHNTDWWGFGENLRRSLPAARLEQVVLLGAGGAGAAAGYALSRMGVGALTIVDTDEGRAGELAARIAALGTAVDAVAPDRLPRVMARADGLVQATPIGMAKLPGMPLPADLLRPDLWVAEIVYVPIETELLRHARALGCDTVDGGGMVVLQAARAFELFTGIAPDPERMSRHLHALLSVRSGEPAL